VFGARNGTDGVGDRVYEEDGVLGLGLLEACMCVLENVDINTRSAKLTREHLTLGWQE
jgi:hypothetical protein